MKNFVEENFYVFVIVGIFLQKNDIFGYQFVRRFSHVALNPQKRSSFATASPQSHDISTKIHLIFSSEKKFSFNKFKHSSWYFPHRFVKKPCSENNCAPWLYSRFSSFHPSPKSMDLWRQISTSKKYRKKALESSFSLVWLIYLSWACFENENSFWGKVIQCGRNFSASGQSENIKKSQKKKLFDDSLNPQSLELEFVDEVLCGEILAKSSADSELGSHERWCLLKIASL